MKIGGIGALLPGYEIEWERVIDACKNRRIIQCTVLKKTRGGFRVKLGKSTYGFLPALQVPFECQTSDKFVGIDIPAKVVKADRHHPLTVSGLVDPSVLQSHRAVWYLGQT